MQALPTFLTAEQKQWDKDFNEALDKFIEDNDIDVEIEPVDPNNPILKRFNGFLRNCDNKPDFLEIKSVKDKKCPITFLIVKVYYQNGPVHLNGIWVIVLEGTYPICFHFPLNMGIHVILNVFFNGNDALLVKHFVLINVVHYHCIVQFIDEPTMHNDIALFNQPTSTAAFFDAFEQIAGHVRKIYCSVK